MPGIEAGRGGDAVVAAAVFAQLADVVADGFGIGLRGCGEIGRRWGEGCGGSCQLAASAWWSGGIAGRFCGRSPGCG